MLLDEAPSTLINECIGNFNITPDRAVLSRIADNLSTLSSHRTAQSAMLQSELKKSTRNLHSLQQKHNIILSAHDPVKHAETIAQYDDERFQLAKEANALESEGSRLEGEVGGLRKQLHELDRKADGEWEGRESELGDVLRLKLYRSLGIDARPDENGSVKKAMVKSARGCEVSVLEMDAKTPVSSYVDKFWEAL